MIVILTLKMDPVLTGDENAVPTKEEEHHQALGAGMMNFQEYIGSVYLLNELHAV